MRNLLTLFLIGFLGICPVLCEAAGFAEGLHGCCEVDATCPHPGEAPSPCPDDGGSCICNGAIQAAAVRIPDAHSTVLPAPVFLTLPAVALRQAPLHHLTWDGAPAGLASFGDSGTVRALLQNYRC